MKTANQPSLGADSELRNANMEPGPSRKAFLARGLASRDEARQTGGYFSAKSVIHELGQMLA